MKTINEPIARQANLEDGSTDQSLQNASCILLFGPPVQAFKNVAEIFVEIQIQGAAQ